MLDYGVYGAYVRRASHNDPHGERTARVAEAGGEGDHAR
jgi:hypothetical protein